MMECNDGCNDDSEKSVSFGKPTSQKGTRN